MIDKIQACMRDAVAVIPDGASVLVGGFGEAGVPYELLHCLAELGRRDLTLIANNAGTHDRGIAALLNRRQVRKIICSHPRPPNSEAFARAFRAGEVELECVPQGTLAERLRAAGAGLGPFYTPTGYGTELAQGRRQEVIDGVGYVLEQPLRGDYALIRAYQGDRWGNLMYRHAARNFNPVMCMAAGHAIAQVDEVVPLGAFTPEHIMTPGLFVKTVVRVET
ncbi:MAG: 3-oxoacid CoA-transferase subunit A [Achromobacter sp.]|uniref:3-oxoadipate CoA-transferase subunit A n=1 Tax=Achromobacter insuavis TaxID=1287735 RepID=A0A6J5B4E5_9BURK|nr:MULTISPECIES: 3-oxoacid CoA-transferase subunit A [Achromobacter]MBN9642641.1 3-oxoacid CoA-transferase subunit A [Achromobacter sp.]MCG2603175.1 3-oxoacid CoA-transferase subunit A [Achromobacter sp.]CAB3689954.1 3-oxoadipate CoA-transferase subunit A [Achromobacter insuavis]CUJ64684.1 3-oxoadipate CoA-transferase subunit A [Achromobacter sp. 2789STDY5608621]CUJ78060.1 3-oxoadipate CoA-transferase subunit A [Achromobacter sp. 2789STDY5608633]